MDDRKQLLAGNNNNNSKSSGYISLTDLKRSDAGNYTCSVTTGFISDSITYQLAVLGNNQSIISQFIIGFNQWAIKLAVPPLPPALHVFQTTVQQIQMQWKAEDDGGSPVRGFLLHWRLADGGDWEERELDRHVTTAQLDVIFLFINTIIIEFK